MVDDQVDGGKLSKAILNRISQEPPLYVWTNDDFGDLSTRVAVDKALQRLVNDNELMRPGRGFYYSPAPQVNSLTMRVRFPTTDSFLKAIVRRDHLSIIVDPHSAAHGLGLETAVPARSIIYADTTPRTVQFKHPSATNDVVIKFLPMLSKRRFWAGRPGMRFVQAMAYFDDVVRRGPDAAARVIDDMARTILGGKSDEAVQAVFEDLRDNIVAMPRWMEPAMRRVLQKVEEGLAPSTTDDIENQEDAGPRP